MSPSYDPSAPVAAFDRFGDLEWGRHEETPFARASFHIHRELLRRFVLAGDRVLEAGAGAGRFTVELARIGARIAVCDISAEQLSLNRRHLEELELGDAVERREQADVVDLRSFADGMFDAVVCYGGPLGYVLERSDDAFAELLRVTRTDGYVLASVMSLAGATRIFFPAMIDDLLRLGPAATDVLRTGYLPPEQSTTAQMHLFTWSDVEALIGRHPCELVAASAANFVTTQHAELIDRLIDDDPATWSAILEWETAMSAGAGVLGAGTHILFVVRTRSDRSG